MLSRRHSGGLRPILLSRIPIPQICRCSPPHHQNKQTAPSLTLPKHPAGEQTHYRRPSRVPYHAAHSVNAGRCALSGPHDDHCRVSTYSSEKMVRSSALLRAYAHGMRGSSTVDAAAGECADPADARRPKQPTDLSASAGIVEAAQRCGGGRFGEKERRRTSSRALLRPGPSFSTVARDAREGRRVAKFSAEGDAAVAAQAVSAEDLKDHPIEVPSSGGRSSDAIRTRGRAGNRHAAEGGGEAGDGRAAEIGWLATDGLSREEVT